MKNLVSSPVKPQSEKSERSSKSEHCCVCDKPVFLLERLTVSSRIFHRTCFKCARCGEQLTLASFYETETGQFCCEICPDEDDSEEDNNDSVSENSVHIDLDREGENSSTQPAEDVNNSTAQNVMNNNTSE